MSKTKKLLSFIFVLLMMVVLVGCELPTPNNTSKNDRTITEAEQALETVANRTTFTTEELEPTTNKLTLTKSYAGMTGVTFVWTSSNEDIISIKEDTENDTYVGIIKRPEKETVEEIGSVTVTITCEIHVSYTKLADGTSKKGTVETTKKFTFTINEVLKSDLITIEEAKTKAKNEVVTVEGVVISIMYQNSYDKNGEENLIRGIFVKDETAGIYVYGGSSLNTSNIKVGDKVKVNGVIKDNYEAIQIEGANSNPLDVEVLDSNQAAPAFTTESTSLSEAIAGEYQSYAGKYHKVYVKVEKVVGENTNINLVDPYTGEAVQLYYRTSIAGITGITIEDTMLKTMEALVGKYAYIPVIVYYANKTDMVTPVRVQLAMGTIEMAEAPVLTDENFITMTKTKLAQLAGTYKPGETVALFATDTTTGATVTYKADVENVIDLTTGKIAETATTQTVTLTATITKGEATKTATIEIKVNKPVANPAPEAGTYVYEVQAKDSNKADAKDITLYALSEMSGFYLGTTTDKTEAAVVTLTKVDGGYTIQLDGKYVKLVKSGKYTNISLDGTSADVWTWNDEAGVMVYDVDGTKCYMGTYFNGDGTLYPTLSAGYLSNITEKNVGNLGTTNFVAKFVEPSDTPACNHVWDDGTVTTKPTCTTAGVKTFTCTECGQTKTETVKATGHTEANAEGKCDNCGADLNSTTTTAPEAGTYVLKTEQASVGKTVYALSEMSGFYVATTENINEAATVTLTKVNGGYTIQLNDKYLRIQKNGTHTNILLDGSAADVWTWNETYGIMTFDVDGDKFFAGNYSTYTTLNAVGLFRISGNNEGALGVSQFAAVLVKTTVVEKTDAEKFTADKTEVTNTLNGKTTLTDNTTFPVTATNGTTIAYTSSNTEVLSISADGTVTVVRPTDKDVEVTVTYTLTLNSETDTNTITVTVKANAGNTTAETITVTTKIADYATKNNWENGTLYSSVIMDDNITVAASGTAAGNYGLNTGKYYTKGNEWRIYGSESGIVEISCAENYKIAKVIIEYNQANTGALADATNATSVYTTGAEIIVNGSSVKLTVVKTGTASNAAQVKITSITVIYEAI